MLTISFLLAHSGFAQDPYSVGTCDQPEAETFLEVGNVRARLLNNGGLFWKGNPNVYEIPAGSGIQASHAANIWIGGMVDSEIRTAASTYGPYELWAGPISDDGKPPQDCSAYDRFWHIDMSTEDRYRLLEDGPSPEALEWPAHLGAPFLDRNGEDGYQPEEGDLPIILGDHSVWWIMNDLGNDHMRTWSKPLGVEVHATAFGFNVPGDLGNTTFYRYRIENEGPKTIDSMGVSMWADFDLGDLSDDRVGTDTTLALFYVYNSDDDDQTIGDRPGYGSPVPAFGITVLEASKSNGSLPTDVHAAAGEHATSSMYYVGSGGVTGDPTRARDHFSFMRGLWKDELPMTLGGNGRDFSLEPMPFLFPGDPVTSAFWSEVNADGAGNVIATADRRGLISYHGFDLAPGEWVQFTFAYVWAKGDDYLDSITELRQATRFLHDNNSTVLAPRTSVGSPSEDGNTRDTPQHPFWVDEPYPNPAADQVTLEMSLKWDAPVTITVTDVLGRTRIQETFQGSGGTSAKALDTSSLTSGTYLIRVSQRGEHVNQTLIVL